MLAESPRRPAPLSFHREVTAALPYVRRFAISLCGNPDRADDLTQETALRALTHHEQFQAGTKLEAWLTTICRNLYYSQHRKDRKQEADIDGERAEAMIGADASAAADSDELDAVRGLMDTLPAETRQALELVAAGDSYEQAAEKLDVEVGTIKSRVNRARETLRLLRDEPGRKRKHETITSSGPRRIDVSKLSPVKPETTLGVPPALQWIKVSDLFVDDRYQRNVLERGLTNVYRIAREFDWRKFTPVVVARADGRFAIVDGQHRSYAAALRHIESVPCLIIDASLAEQAAAFAAINTRVTRISELHVHAAAVVAGDAEALALDTVCRSAGVSIARYPIPETKIRPGTTLAIGVLRLCLRLHGERILTLALRCLMTAHLEHRGALRAPLIRAVCDLVAKFDEARPQELLRWSAATNFVQQFVKARMRSAENGGSVRPELFKGLCDAFSEFEGRQ